MLTRNFLTLNFKLISRFAPLGCKDLGIRKFELLLKLTSFVLKFSHEDIGMFCAFHYPKYFYVEFNSNRLEESEASILLLTLFVSGCETGVPLILSTDLYLIFR